MGPNCSHTSLEQLKPIRIPALPAPCPPQVMITENSVGKCRFWGKKSQRTKLLTWLVLNRPQLLPHVPRMIGAHLDLHPLSAPKDNEANNTQQTEFTAWPVLNVPLMFPHVPQTMSRTTHSDPRLKIWLKYYLRIHDCVNSWEQNFRSDFLCPPRGDAPIWCGNPVYSRYPVYTIFFFFKIYFVFKTSLPFIPCNLMMTALTANASADQYMYC